MSSRDHDGSPAVLASRRAAVAARRVAGALITSQAPVELLEDAAADLEALAARLEPSSGRSRYDGSTRLPFTPGAAPAVLERHPFLGASNPLAPPMVLELVEDGAVGVVTLDGRHEGAPGWVHGGWISALFDQVLAVAAARVAGRPAMTGTLTIRYLYPTPVGTELRFAATARRTSERTLRAGATVSAGERVTAEAEATLVLARPDPAAPPTSGSA